MYHLRKSSEIDLTGSISEVGDRMVRTALYQAPNMMVSHSVRMSPLKSWRGGQRRGAKKARVALASKLAASSHRLWLDGTSFR